MNAEAICRSKGERGQREPATDIGIRETFFACIPKKLKLTITNILHSYMKISDKRRQFLHRLAMPDLQPFCSATSLDSDIVSIIGGYLTMKVCKVYVYKPQSLFQVPLSSIKCIDEGVFRRPDPLGKQIYPGMQRLYRRHGDIKEWLKKIDVESWSSKKIQQAKNYNERLKEHWEKVYGAINHTSSGVLL
mmetsp:Transcript_5438/g.8577  ORF Transcript_5438/g.8577 Transcript_5438/m.8577 type:complete len:190 (+) Transcript_5438:285-854(+)